MTMPKPNESIKPRNQRLAGRLLMAGGIFVTVSGGLAVVIGGALPWARFALFGVPLALPGILLGAGSLTMGAGILSLTYARRYPALVFVLGIAAIAAGATAPQLVGHSVVQTLLRIDNSIAPANARLAQVALPPIEPFPSIMPANTYVGEGPAWTFYGGIALALGSTLRMVGSRVRRTCVSCHFVWDTYRADKIVYCPRCGFPAALATDCSVCHALLKKRDLFCWKCGTERSPYHGEVVSSA